MTMTRLYIEANVSSKGAERFPRPLHTLSHSSSLAPTLLLWWARLPLNGSQFGAGFASRGRSETCFTLRERLFSCAAFLLQHSSHRHRYVAWRLAFSIMHSSHWHSVQLNFNFYHLFSSPALLSLSFLFLPFSFKFVLVLYSPVSYSPVSFTFLYFSFRNLLLYHSPVLSLFLCIILVCFVLSAARLGAHRIKVWGSRFSGPRFYYLLSSHHRLRTQQRLVLLHNYVRICE